MRELPEPEGKAGGDTEIGDLMYLYTAKKNEAGQLVYVVDGLPETAEDFRYPAI